MNLPPPTSLDQELRQIEARRRQDRPLDHSRGRRPQAEASPGDTPAGPLDKCLQGIPLIEAGPGCRSRYQEAIETLDEPSKSRMARTGRAVRTSLPQNQARHWTDAAIGLLSVQCFHHAREAVLSQKAAHQAGRAPRRGSGCGASAAPARPGASSSSHGGRRFLRLRSLPSVCLQWFLGRIKFTSVPQAPGLESPTPPPNRDAL